jgi:DHA1 family inner membrane transport protein
MPGARPRWIALLALATCTFVYVTSENLPIGLLLSIGAELRVSSSTVGLLVTAYGLTVVVSSIPLTQLTGRLPRRPLLSALLAVFVLSTAATALAPGYGALMTARVVAALSQALFWSVVTPTAAGLVAPELRGRALSVIFGGATLATVVGVPAGTWVGELAGWRAAFGALAGLGLVAAAGAFALLPRGRAGEEAVVRVGTSPDARRYWIMVITTAVAVTGAFVAYTYVTPFLTEVGKVPAGTLSGSLLARGLAGLAGVAAAGPLVDRWPTAAVVGPVALQAAALLALHTAGAQPAVAVALVALTGFALSALATALGSRVLALAPGRADLASAVTSTAFNVGITAGALAGGAVLEAAGVRATALVGGLLSLLALAVGLSDRLTAARLPRRVATP